jgi:hypothetical protein
MLVPPDGTSSLNPFYLLWHRQNQLLLGWIWSSLTESIQLKLFLIKQQSISSLSYTVPFPQLLELATLNSVINSKPL